MFVLIVLFLPAVCVWSVLLLRHGLLQRPGTLPRFGLVVLLTGVIAGPACFAVRAGVSLSLDRLLWGMLVGWYALFRWAGRVEPRAWSRVEWLLLAWAGWLLVGAVAGGAPPPGTSALARWLFYVALPVGTYLIARQSRARPEDLRWVAWGLVALGLYLGATALAERWGLHAIVLPRHIVDPGHVEFFGRGRGPLLNPIANGMLMAGALTAAVLKLRDLGRPGQIALSIGIVVILGGIYATLTRSCWIGAAAGLAIIAWNRLPRWTRVWGLACGAVLGGIVAMGAADELLALKRDKHLSPQAAAESVKLRPILAVVAVEMFQDRPIAGVGYGHYLNHSIHYLSDRSWGLPLEKVRPYIQHNVFLGSLVETGLVGILMFLALLISWAASGVRLIRDGESPEARMIGYVLLAFLTTYVVNGIFHEVSVIDMIHMFLFYLAGLASGAAKPAGEVGRGRARAVEDRRRTLAVPAG